MLCINYSVSHSGNIPILFPFLEYTVEEVGTPLYLTPYIQSKRLSEARDRAQVRGLPWPGKLFMLKSSI